MKKGFTLIEILIGLGVMLILLTAASSGLSNANKRQTLDQVTENVRQAFFQARTNAQAGKKDCTACGATGACGTGDAPLDGWRVTIVDPDTYRVEGVCGANTAFSTRNYDLPSGITMVGSKTSVTFKPVGLGTDLGPGEVMTVAVYRTSGDTGTKSFQVNPAGEVTGITFIMNTPTTAPTATITPTPGAATATPPAGATATPTPASLLPIGWWKMNEASWTNNCSTGSVLDSSGNALNGKSCPSGSGPVGGAVGQYGNAGSFDGTDDYLIISDTNNSLDVPNITVSAWIYKNRNDPTWGAIVTRQFSTGSADLFSLYYSNSANDEYGLLTRTSGGQDSLTTTSSIGDIGTWVHLTGTYDGTTMRLYKNGIEIGSKTHAFGGSMISETNSVTIAGQFNGPGADAGMSERTQAVIDNVRIYNYARSLAELQNDMNDGGSVTPTPTPTPAACSFGPYSIPGRIEMENYKCGGEGVGYHDTDATNNGGLYRPSDGVDIPGTSDVGGGYKIGWTAATEWLQYSLSVASAGIYDLRVRVASAVATGSFSLKLDGVSISGVISVPNTGGWENWTTLVVPNIAFSAGSHTLELDIAGNDGDYNYIDAAVAANTPTPTSTSQAVSVRVTATGKDGGSYGTTEYNLPASSPYGRLYVGYDAGTIFDGGWIFQTTIPQGKTITNATVTITGGNDNTGTITGSWYGFKTISVVDFQNNVSGHRVSDHATKTTASVADNFGVVANGSTHVSPNLTAVVQELVNQAGFTGLIGMTYRSSTATNSWQSFIDYTDNSGQAALLTVTYVP
ncbi:MAG: coagulation factor 5/8 type domain-containing protein [Microgenomates group bacterium Gr01-1014_16]|nr:MAG: coagulation factor 5/8 type domain-containing protein [Microgenomates group bacterium Gr01-1014_16]